MGQYAAMEVYSIPHNDMILGDKSIWVIMEAQKTSLARLAQLSHDVGVCMT